MNARTIGLVIGAVLGLSSQAFGAALEGKDLARVVAAEVGGSGNGPAALGLLLSGRQMALWGSWPGKAETRRAAAEKAPVLNSRLFGVIRDLQSSHNSRAANRELKFRNAILVLAAQATPEALANSARDTRSVTVEKLLREPVWYRGKVIQVRGRLKLLQGEDAPDSLKRQGIDKLYEGRIFTDDLDTSPVGVLFSELPPEIKTGDNIDYPVIFNGYFFKKQVSKVHGDLLVMPLLIGQSVQRWKGKLRKHDPATAPLINHLLINVQDEKDIPETADKNIEEAWAYAEIIALASRTPEEAFDRSAKANSYVTWSHLLRDPRTYRGRVIPVRGRLQRLRRLDVPKFMKVRGIKALYEGWIGQGQRRATCVVFTELPPGIKVGEEVDYPILFKGYFFKKWRHHTQEGDRFSPLLVGRTIEQPGKQAPSGLAGSLSTGFVVGLTGLIGGTIFLVVGLGWWFRRGDRRLQRRLAELHGQPFLEPAPDNSLPAGDGNARKPEPPMDYLPDGSPGTRSPDDNGFRRHGL